MTRRPMTRPNDHASGARAAFTRSIGRAKAASATQGTRGGTAAALLVLHAAATAGAIGIVISSAGATVLRPLLIFFLVLGGVAAVLWPGSGAGLVASTGVVVGYVLLTSLGSVLERAGSPTPSRVLLLTACLYVAHATDALRGTVGRAELDPSVLLRWLRRLAEALLPGLAIGALVLALPPGDGGSPVWLLGAVAVLAAAAVPALRVQRRPWRTATQPPTGAAARSSDDKFPS